TTTPRGPPPLASPPPPCDGPRPPPPPWLRHMRDAVDELDLAPELEHQLWNYMTYAAASMINTVD
ncbi:globin, partial [Streptomyces abikoensis]